MSDKNEIVEVETTEIIDEREMFDFDLRAPIVFEGKEYEKMDLSPISTMTGKDLRQVLRMLGKGMDIEVLPEVSMEYAFALCAVACKLPLEFFDKLSARDSVRLKTRVIGFLFS